MKSLLRLSTLFFWLFAAAVTQAADLQIAVAANFLGTLQKLTPAFEQATGHKVTLAGGASGQFYQQIVQGAPFDIFLSADTERPQKLEQEGLGIPGSRFTYAIGKVVLWSPQEGLVDDKGEVLKQAAKYTHLSIANPATAPYGAAAKQVLEHLKLWDGLTADNKIVTGESIAQTLQFVTSKNAELGFVALAQVISADGGVKGSSWQPPQELYDPITQDVVILKRTEQRAAAEQFTQWLKTDPKVQAAILAAGYSVPKK